MATYKHLSDDDILSKIKELKNPRQFIGNRAEVDGDIEALVYELVIRKVYPRVSKTGMPALNMVFYYGQDWHIFREPLACHHCGEDLRNHELGPPFKREIGHIATGGPMDDFVERYVCPKCLCTL